MPATALSMDHVAMMELGSVHNAHCMDANCNTNMSVNDCLEQCLASSTATHDQQSIIIQLSVFAIFIVALIVFIVPLNRVRNFYRSIFPPPLYLFDTVRLVE